MRKAILMMLLAIVSSSAGAGWVAIAGDKTIEVSYVDPPTIRKTGNMVKMWDLMDFKVQAPSDVAGSMSKPFLSVRTQREYDCKEEQIRVLFVDFHSGNMGRGEIVSRGSNPGKWEPVPPGSYSELWWKFACGKR